MSDAEGNAFAFDIATGHQLWHQQHCDNPQDHDKWDFTRLEWPPALTSGLVIIDTGEETFGCDRGDGRLRWKLEGARRPTVVDGLLLRVGIDRPRRAGRSASETVPALPPLQRGMEALDAATGQLRWQTSVPSDGYTYSLSHVHPTIAEGMVLMTEGFDPHCRVKSGLHAFDLHTGALRWEIWEDNEQACPRMPPCDRPDRVGVSSGRTVWAHGLVWIVEDRFHADYPYEETLVGLDPRTGRPERTLSLKGFDDPDEIGSGMPIFGHDLLYCLGDERIDALDLATGTVRWTQRLTSPTVGSLLLAGNILHMATENGGLQALDADTGDPRWSIVLNDETAMWEPPFPVSVPLAGTGYEAMPAPFVLIDGSLFVRTDNAVLQLR
ncbi:PQQ-binding-like beta-propeller repeat protein [Nonomuraea sp. CA-143628]|uniref:PQQ-binding-like beta-propeller repeat protein n=1 Tax=Nonomuraea sp. CA-143628 TaxID=3239997 RepID=UPI003D9076E3